MSGLVEVLCQYGGWIEPAVCRPANRQLRLRGPDGPEEREILRVSERLIEGDETVIPALLELVHNRPPG